MSIKFNALSMAMLSIAAFISIGDASAADLPLVDYPVKATAPVGPVPFFFVNDNFLSYAYTPGWIEPATPNRGVTATNIVGFTHFDTWAYGTNYANLTYYMHDKNDPAAPCGYSYTASNCGGADEFYGLIRSTFGFNQLFDTRAFTVGPLHNVSFEVGVDGSVENTFAGISKKSASAGLQFAFDLPYKGYLNIAPMYYKEINHNSFTQCGLFGPGVPGVTCLSDGTVVYNGTWSLEANYYMNLGFLPENLQYFSVSGRATWRGPKGNANAPLGVAGGGIETKTELNSEPIRLTFDASKFAWGPSRSHFIDLWIAYDYWQNKSGLDHVLSSLCTGIYAGSCTESSYEAGVTVKF
jgi:hypothetical protein